MMAGTACCGDILLCPPGAGISLPDWRSGVAWLAVYVNSDHYAAIGIRAMLAFGMSCPACPHLLRAQLRVLFAVWCCITASDAHQGGLSVHFLGCGHFI